MNRTTTRRALLAAVDAARSAGALMRRHLAAPKTVNAAFAHDIKLELDVRCQHTIEARLRAAFPTAAVYGEEGTSGDPGAPLRWVVDPIDGTVNFAYGMPHACVSIALEQRLDPPPHPAATPRFLTVIGVVYDPFTAELWTAIRGGPTRLNGRTVAVSSRSRLADAIVALGFGKHSLALSCLLPSVQALTPRARKLRIMGSAALDLAYVASGRFDAYFEAGLRLWDVAAGCLLVESAGGDTSCLPMPDGQSFHVLATNGRLRRSLRRLLPPCPSR